jgi:hypothetical protein
MSGMAGAMKSPALSKKLMENLQGDLRALSTEAKRKHPQVKEVGQAIASILARSAPPNSSHRHCRIFIVLNQIMLFQICKLDGNNLHLVLCLFFIK